MHQSSAVDVPGPRRKTPPRIQSPSSKKNIGIHFGITLQIPYSATLLGSDIFSMQRGHLG